MNQMVSDLFFNHFFNCKFLKLLPRLWKIISKEYELTEKSISCTVYVQTLVQARIFVLSYETEKKEFTANRTPVLL